MSSTTYAPQEAAMAAATRPCTGLGRGTQWNVAMCTGLAEFGNDIATKHPAQRLESIPT